MPLLMTSVRLSLAGACVVAGAVAWTSCARRSSADREVWAEVDGQSIYRDQVDRIYRGRVKSGSDAGNPEQAQSFKLSILNELINNQILIQHASRSRITVTEAEVDARIAELESPYSKEEFRNRLAEQGLEGGDLRQEVRDSLILSKLINKEISSHLAVTEAEIAAYYERNKASFNVSETQYHLAQIEVTPVADTEVRNLKNDDAKSPRDAVRKIQALYARLRAGDDFAVIAQEYSEDPRTSTGGGDMGFIPASSLNATPELKRAVSGLKEGEFSGIFQSSRGFHIVKLLDEEAGGQRPLSDPRVQSAIRQALMNEKEQLLKAAYIEVLRNRARVVNLLANRIVRGEAGGEGK